MFEPLRRETDRAGLEIRKSFQVKGLRMSSAESIVTKRVALAELRFLARNEPVNQLTQKAESDRSRLFAFLDPFSRVCDDSSHETEILVPQRLLSGSESNHGGWARTPGATLSNSLTLWLTSATP